MKKITKILTILMITIMLTELTINLTYAVEEKKVTINEFDPLWQFEDEFTESTYYVTSQVELKSFKVSLEEADNELPEGIRITDENFEDRDEFEANEKFKICIPWTSLKDRGNLKINIEATDNDGKIYYDSLIREYEDNVTSILIIKKNFETEELLEGVEFEVLNSNKEVIRSNIKTNRKGQIYINALLPGTYYVREVNTIPGYELNENIIEVKLELYEAVDAIFNAIRKPNIESNENNNSTPDTNTNANENIEDKEIDEEELKENTENKTDKDGSEEIKNFSETGIVKTLPITGM